MSLYKRGLNFIGDAGPVTNPDQENADPRLVAKYPHQWVGIMLADDGTFEGVKSVLTFNTEGEANEWYGRVTLQPSCLYAATWDMWGTSWWSSDAPNQPNIANHYKSPAFVESGRPEPIPADTGVDMIITQPGITSTAETAADDDGDSDGGGSGLLLGVGAALAGAGLLIAGTGKKRRKR